MRRPPVLATLVVAAAIAAMVTLGLWQLRRATWKEALLARYAAARRLPPVALAGPGDETLLFRRAVARCRPPITWTVAPGPDHAGRPGWRHLAHCTGDLMADMGWSAGFQSSVRWPGGMVTGPVAARPSPRSVLTGAFVAAPTPVLIVAETPAPGLSPSAPPDLAAIPNNHRAYAGQWFLFAAMALVVYLLALRRRAQA